MSGIIYYENLTDEELVELSQNRDANAQEHLIRRYKVFAAGKAKKYFIAGGDNEDVIQEGMIGIFKAIRDYEKYKGASFKTFVDLCITRQILTAVEGSQRKKHKILNDAVSLNLLNSNDDEPILDVLEYAINGQNVNPEMEIIAKDLLEGIINNKPKIFSKMESLIIKKLIEGMSYTEIAEYMGKSPKSIDNGIQRVKKKIENYLKKGC